MAGVRRPFGWTVFVAVALSLVCSSAGAQTIKTGTAPRIQSLAGVDSFKAYCAMCHGDQGKGDGPAAAALKKVPADLTGIAKRHGGRFSATDVERVIAGTDVMNSHGSREMPIWGPVFQALAPSSEMVILRVNNLVEYIR